MKSKKAEEENRLYFIIRSWIMGQIGAVIFLIIVWYLVTINFIQSLILGAFVFVSSLVISRFFEPEINKLIKKIMKFLNKNPKLKKFILKYF